MLTVLIADDDGLSRAEAHDELRTAGYRVACAAGSLEALKMAEAQCPDIVVTDVRFGAGEPHGFALGRMLRARFPKLPIIYITGYPDLASREPVAAPVLVKPLEAGALAAEVAAQLAKLQD